MTTQLTVVIPAYNEDARLGATLERVCAYLGGLDRTWDVLVVDDGSRDRTPDLVREIIGRQPQVQLLVNEVNRGKGYTVRRGMLAARGEYVLFSDADLSSPIEEVEKLLPFVRSGFDVAIGSRDIIGSKIEVPQPLHRRLMGYSFMVLRDWIAVSGFRDTQCGFKLFKNAAAQEVFSRGLIDGFCFDVEILAIAKALGYRMCEVPVIWRNDERSKVNPVGDPIKMFRDLFRIRLNAMRGLYGGKVPPGTPGT
ncbi:MAG: glycosyltransferase family 2 protein [Candidatus Riflebacteria bacterium]|nr:glycosyltransferase family 2 protein [Candidatus Riflebacteria bacterium]